ncbi:MAG: PIN domain-containing protein [SAR324 cluster bacterium]|jgi:predicted nucleic acid-binding protein|nr:PIN domain-containing protein [SAR324 cluster bacterium]
MILIDSTVWINFFADQQTAEVSKFESFVNEEEDLCVCGVIMTELLQGISDDQEFQKTKTLLAEMIYLPMSSTTFIQSAEIYRTLRKMGITIRKTIDFLIAALCIEHEVQLLHNDRDFTFIADHFPLRQV